MIATAATSTGQPSKTGQSSCRCAKKESDSTSLYMLYP